MTRIAVLGAGPHGLEIRHALTAYGLTGVSYDDDPDDFPAEGCLAGATSLPWILGTFWPEARRAQRDAIWQRAGRRAVALQAPYNGGRYVHASAVLGHDAILHEHVHVGPGAVISGRCTLNDFASIAPGAVLGGDVVVDDCAVVGAGATIIHGAVHIGAGAFVGAGAVVIDDVPPGVVVAGNPAKIIAHEWNYRDMARGRRGRPRLASP